MRLITLTDSSAFAEQSLPFLSQHEAENNLLLSSAIALAKSRYRGPKLEFYVVKRSGQTICAGLNSPERRLLISDCDESAALFLGTELRRCGAVIRGVLGPGVIPRSAAEAYMVDATTLFLRTHQIVMKVERTVLTYPDDNQTSRSIKNLPRTRAAGLMRRATAKDLPLLISWARQFTQECDIDEPAFETEESVRRYVEERRFVLWFDQKPVAMAAFSGPTPNGVRINMVFTDPAWRQGGYAKQLVYNLSHKLLNAGNKFCFLFADVNNRHARTLYHSLGFVSTCEFSEFRFRPAQARNSHDSAIGSSVTTTG